MIFFIVPRAISGRRTTGPELEAYLEGTGRFTLLRRHRLALGRPNHAVASIHPRSIVPVAPRD